MKGPTHPVRLARVGEIPGPGLNDYSSGVFAGEGNTTGGWTIVSTHGVADGRARIDRSVDGGTRGAGTLAECQEPNMLIADNTPCP